MMTKLSPPSCSSNISYFFAGSFSPVQILLKSVFPAGGLVTVCSCSQDWIFVHLLGTTGQLKIFCVSLCLSVCVCDCLCHVFSCQTCSIWCVCQSVKCRIYQCKVSVDMLNAVKSELADVSSVRPSSEKKGCLSVCQLMFFIQPSVAMKRRHSV